MMQARGAVRKGSASKQSSHQAIIRAISAATRLLDCVIASVSSAVSARSNQSVCAAMRLQSARTNLLSSLAWQLAFDPCASVLRQVVVGVSKTLWEVRSFKEGKPGLRDQL